MCDRMGMLGLIQRSLQRTWHMSSVCLMWVVLSIHAQAQPGPATKPLVLLVSIDGFKPAYVDKVNTPHLFQLQQSGAHARGLLSSFPSLTFPNHLSMVTGQTPDHHGIVNNTMTDPELPGTFSLGSRDVLNDSRWWSQAKPIWLTLHAQGKRSSTLFWPGSEVPIQGIQPDDWLPYQHAMSHESRIQTLMNWLKRPSEDRADFATLYFSDVDSAGHQHGPDSAEVASASHAVDRSIGKLIQELKASGLWADTTLIIASDHGMRKVDHLISVAHVLPARSKAQWEWMGPLAGIRLRGEDAASIWSQLAQLPHAQCWPKAQLPQRFKFGQHPRVPDIVCLAEPGYAMNVDPSRKGPLGQHGYDPIDESMWGILIASGHRIAPMSADLVDNVDLYPFLCRLLDIQAELNDGNPNTLSRWIRP